MLGALLISPLCYCYLGYALSSIDRPPWLRDFYCWYGFLLGLAPLYEPFGVGDYKGPYAPTGKLLEYMCGTQHWGAMQYTHNHAYSRTVYILLYRVVTFGENNFGYNW